MPFKMTDYLEGRILNLILRGSNASAGISYLGLFTVFDPAADGNSFTEISTSGTGYVRQPVTFSAFSAGASANSNLIDFPMATADWGTPIYMGLFDSLSGGNMMYWGQVQNPIPINSGDQFEAAIGGLTVTISGLLTPTLASKIGDHTLRNVTYASPAAIWVASLSTFVNESSYSEVSDANYARQSVTFTAPANSFTTVANVADVTWAAAAGPYTVNYLSLFDASSGGNMLLRGPFAPPRSLLTGKVLKLPAGSLTCTAD